MCGIVGVMGSSRASQEVHQALLMLQHRGQDSAGILSVDAHTGKFHLHKELGQVSQVFNRKMLDSLTGKSAIGHTRYSTIGEVKEQDLQPMVASLPVGIGMVHNGNVSNYDEMRSALHRDQRYFMSDNDLEIMLHKIADQFSTDAGQSPIDALSAAVTRVLREVEGGYSVVGLLGSNGLFAFRDSHGIRPLILGKSVGEDGKTSYCLTSETCVLKFLNYEYVRDIRPGEMVWIGLNGQLISRDLLAKKPLPCMFEWVYFSGADSTLEGRNVYETRLKLGELLAARIPKGLEIDVVAPVPDTSRPAAIGLAEKLNLPFREVLIKNRYVQRSFITNGQEKRNLAVKLKFSVIDELVAGKNVLLVDDSIVRGTTSRKIIELLKSHGAKRVYFASTCPPITHPCYYGIDFPNREELVANHRSVAQVSDYLHADGVFYTELSDLTESLKGLTFCKACLTGDYPYPVNQVHRVESGL